MAKYRILYFDGGGIRGIVTLILLGRLKDQFPSLVKNTSLLAGTPTGGIIALGLAAGKSLEELTTLYQQNGKDIFADSWWDDLVDLGKIAGAEYDSKNLAKLLTQQFGSARMKDLEKRLLVPTFDLDNEHDDPTKRTWKPLFVHNYPGEDSDGDRSIVEVAISTIAAPTYFPSHNGNIDGGVVANNPSMAAVTRTQDKRARIDDRPTLDELLVLSIGTGTVLSYVKGKNHEWGFAQWARPLISLLMDASMASLTINVVRFCEIATIDWPPCLTPG